ncbi:alpha/beta hydrolase [Pseudomonas sp. 148P]|uniref:Alpha/beta hydrolase n=1 Tax=Pseudomonas ulcerans TaxID=3115852 RepID=A0ABU7HWS7_9PSED|nr:MULTISPECIES: alpha/beta hydrolase [unclassified Pseudomonas]MEE1924424.1 alpha/beta hydrolase [Pseudomonas sp. 147P]MEE1936025.1 alpha/beta hydrolase [Pseudomonas sp. 148P]
MSSLSIVMEVASIPTPWGALHARRWFPERPDPRQPVIVLMHDSLGCVELWRDFPALLCQCSGLEVVAYDRLGFGQSARHPGALPLSFIGDEADSVFPLLREALGIERFIAFGHSVGGAMASVCAARHGQDCVALVTESAQAFVEARTLEGIRLAKAQFREPGQLERLAKYHDDKAQWVLEAWTETWLADAFSNWTLADTAGAVGCPTLVLHGDLDEYGSLAQPERIAALAGDKGRTVILDGCHHVPHREDPQRVLDRVLAFLREVL